MIKVKQIPKLQENGWIILVNQENGRWVKMPLEVYERYNGMPCGESILNAYLEKKFGLFSHDINQTPRLKSVYLALTGKCNLCCSFCTMNSGPQVSTEKNLTFDEIQKILIPKLLEIKPGKIVLTGGEPFVRRDIIDIICLIGKAFDKRIITLQTNGLLIDAICIKQIKRYVGSIEFSIENLFTNSKDMNKMKKLFTACMKEDIPISFSFVIHQGTRKFLEEAIELCHTYKAYLALRPVSMVGRAKNNHREDWTSGEQEKNQIYLEILRYIISRHYYEEQFSGLFLEMPQLRQNCGAFGNIAAIHADGTVLMCENFKTKRYILGDIRSDPIKKIKENAQKKMHLPDYVKEFRDKPEICRTCNVRYFCSGPCIAERAENEQSYVLECGIKKKLLEYNLFYRDNKRTIEYNLKNLLNFLEDRQGA